MPTNQIQKNPQKRVFYEFGGEGGIGRNHPVHVYVYVYILIYSHIEFKVNRAMNNVRWSIVVPEETDRALRTFLAQRGTKKGDISRFVEDAVQSRLFELSVEGIKDRNRSYKQNEIMDVIDEAQAGK
jgi:hypothetical protein